MFLFGGVSFSSGFILSIWPVIFCSNDDPGLTLPIICLGQILHFLCLYKENCKAFYEKNIQKMTRWTNDLCLYKKV